MKRKFIGFMSRIMGSIPVGRALDSAKPGNGRIYLPDPVNDPTLIRGVGTQFDQEAEKGGMIVLPTVNGTSASSEILEIKGPEEIRLKKEMKGADPTKQLTGRTDINEDGQFMNGSGGKDHDVEAGFEGTTYKTAPKVDQTKVYDAVFSRLNVGGCVCIFPEGGSHDRTELLPLKGTSFSP